MPTITAETGSCLTNIGIWCQTGSGKLQDAFQTFYKMCLSEASGSTGKPARKPRNAAKASAAETTSPAKRRGRPPGSSTRTPREKTAAADGKAENITERVLRAVVASAAGISRQALLANPTLKGARPNHIGAAIKRHLKAGRLVERDSVLYNTTAQRIAA